MLWNIRHGTISDIKNIHIVYLLRCLIRTNINTPGVIVAQWYFVLTRTNTGFYVISGYGLRLMFFLTPTVVKKQCLAANFLWFDWIHTGGHTSRKIFQIRCLFKTKYQLNSEVSTTHNNSGILSNKDYPIFHVKWICGLPNNTVRHKWGFYWILYNCRKYNSLSG